MRSACACVALRVRYMCLDETDERSVPLENSGSKVPRNFLVSHARQKEARQRATAHALANCGHHHGVHHSGVFPGQ
eukprot:3507659-Pleurochrysis_carterae.AAC.1